MQTTTKRRGQSGQWIRMSTRLAIYSRDGFCCAFCGACSEDGVVMTLDHVLARELGGSNKPSNLVSACLSCNSSKQDSSLRDWFRILRDRGIDTTKVARRVRRLTKTPIDRNEGRRLEAIRQESN